VSGRAIHVELKEAKVSQKLRCFHLRNFIRNSGFIRTIGLTSDVVDSATTVGLR